MTFVRLPRIAALLSVFFGAAYALGCSDSGAAGDSAADASAVVDAGGSPSSDAGASAQDASVATDAASSAAPITVSASDFDCIVNWQKVRGFRIKRIGGGPLSESLAVANSATGGTYPPGTVLQLVPTEAMVKRERGFSPATKDWEFFFLDAQKSATTIRARGTTNVVNGFGGNCFDCHNQAQPQWDLICEQSHGCAPLPISSATIQSIQAGDPRCN
jgi:hypothetical protein